MKKLASALCALSLALTLSACGGGSDTASDSAPSADVDPELQALLPPEVRESGALRGASSFTTPPLYTFAKDGRTPSGVLIELIEGAADRLGIEITWSQIPYTGIIPAMSAGNVDLSGSQYSATGPNLEVTNILAVYRNTVALVVPSDDEDRYDGLEDACGTNVAVVRGSTIEPPAVAKINDACASAGKDPVTETPYAGASDALTALKAGRVDSFMLSFAPALYNAENDSASFATVLGGEFESYPSGFAINKPDVQVAEAFEAAFAAMIEDGTYAEIMEKWSMPDELYIDAPSLNEPVQ